MDKKSFILHIDACEIFNDLDDQFAGKLIKAIVGYQVYGEIREDTDQTIKLLSKSFIQQFKRDDEKYKKVLERNKKNIEKRWEKNKTEDIKKDTSGISGNKNLTKRYQPIPTDTKNTDNGSGNGSDNGSCNGSGNDILEENINQNPLTSILLNQKENKKSNRENLSQVEARDTNKKQFDDIPDILTKEASFKLIATDTPKKENKASGGQKRGARIDPDLVLSDEWIACAYGVGDKIGINLEIKTIEIEFEKFKNYWISKAGAGACKVDWIKTWSNWIYNGVGSKPIHKTSSGYKPYQSKAEINSQASQQIKDFIGEQEVLTGKKYGIFSR